MAEPTIAKPREASILDNPLALSTEKDSVSRIGAFDWDA